MFDRRYASNEAFAWRWKPPGVKTCWRAGRAMAAGLAYADLGLARNAPVHLPWLARPGRNRHQVLNQGLALEVAAKRRRKQPRAIDPACGCVPGRCGQALGWTLADMTLEIAEAPINNANDRRDTTRLTMTGPAFSAGCSRTLCVRQLSHGFTTGKRYRRELPG